MTPEQLKLTIEAILMAADEPLNSRRLKEFLADSSSQDIDVEIIKKALLELQQDYLERSIELVDTASGYSFRVKKDYGQWVVKLWEVKPPRYSRVLMETLALIAYKQPITRAEIEQVRGVAVNSYIIKTLMERDWIKIIGHKDLPGKPALLATTKVLLDHFNLKSLTELPSLEELKDLDQMGEQLEIQLAPAVDLEPIVDTVEQFQIEQSAENLEQEDNLDSHEEIEALQQPVAENME